MNVRRSWRNQRCELSPNHDVRAKAVPAFEATARVYHGNTCRLLWLIDPERVTPRAHLCTAAWGAAIASVLIACQSARVQDPQRDPKGADMNSRRLLGWLLMAAMAASAAAATGCKDKDPAGTPDVGAGGSPAGRGGSGTGGSGGVGGSGGSSCIFRRT
jgi:hypothetical protein